MTNRKSGRGCLAIRRWTFVWAGLALAGMAIGADRPLRRDEIVNVRREPSGCGIRLIVENRASCDVTVTLSLDASNVRVDQIMPQTATYCAHSETEALWIFPDDPTKRCSWRFHYSWVKGDVRAAHDPNTVYLLPFEAGRSFRVSQGYNGKLTHFDQDQYAVDFAMREGTAICAARAGIVVDIEQSYKAGGPSKKYKDRVNFVSIAHADGTVGEYCHLQQNGALVEIGDRVEAGQRIALSGNTGYSTFPHLHFGVYSPIDGKQLQSHPVRFSTRQGIIPEPQEGRRYTALSLPTQVARQN